jgi:hypothetical protein
MQKIFTFIAALLAVSTSFADLELQSLRCSTKNLTLRMALVSDTEGAGLSVQNAKGYLVFTARDTEGQKILRDKTVEKVAQLATETWSNKFLIRSFSGRTVSPLNSRSDLIRYLSQEVPLIYYFNDTPQELRGMVSYVKGQRIIWSECTPELENQTEITTNQTVASFPISKLRDYVYCPANREKEKEIIMSKGAAFLRDGKEDFCLTKILNRHLSLRGKTTKTMNLDELKGFVSDLRVSIMNAQTKGF